MLSSSLSIIKTKMTDNHFDKIKKPSYQSPQCLDMKTYITGSEIRNYRNKHKILLPCFVFFIHCFTTAWHWSPHNMLPTTYLYHIIYTNHKSPNHKLPWKASRYVTIMSTDRESMLQPLRNNQHPFTLMIRSLFQFT